MALLYLWALERGDIANFAAPIGGAVFDLNINGAQNLVKDEYETRFGRKHIVFRDGQPWCRNLKSGQWVRSGHCTSRATSRRRWRGWPRARGWPMPR